MWFKTTSEDGEREGCSSDVRWKTVAQETFCRRQWTDEYVERPETLMRQNVGLVVVWLQCLLVDVVRCSCYVGARPCWHYWQHKGWCNFSLSTPRTKSFLEASKRTIKWWSILLHSDSSSPVQSSTPCVCRSIRLSIGAATSEVVSIWTPPLG